MASKGLSLIDTRRMNMCVCVSEYQSVEDGVPGSSGLPGPQD